LENDNPMDKTLSIFSNTIIHDFIKNILFEYNVTYLTEEKIKDVNLINKNIIFFINEEKLKKINREVFLKNNSIIFLNQQQTLRDNYSLEKINIFYGPLKIKKFIYNLKSCFFQKSVSFKDVKITENQLINISTKANCLLTQLETEILIELIDKKKIKRDKILEKIFKIKKDIETKTIESHLSRIRKKLLIIKSEVKISLKEEVFFLDC